ncbi:MAG TPA: efflux RND transporter permease subunit, partial [Marinagarivorans sp.]|nr:efflux RND transporter permease subunit [Marinagarivorans sp.]
FYSTFRRLVERCVEFRKTTIALSLATFVLGLVGFRFVEQQFFPDSNRLELMVELWLPEGASYVNMERQALDFEAFIKQRPQVDHYTSYIGTGAPRFYLPQDQILPQTNVAQIVVVPKDLAGRNQLRDIITREFAVNFPEVRGRVRYLPSGPPVPYPVQFRISGPDPQQVRGIADQVKELVRANPNCIGVNDNWNEAIKVLRLDLDQDKLRAVGLTSELVMQAANTILSGATIGQYRENNRLIDIQIRQPLDERDTIERLNDTNIPTQNGTYVTLSNIARAYFVWEPGLIWRENREWAVTVQADVKDGIQGPTVSSQIIPLLADIKAQLPLGYAVKLAGAAADSSKAQDSIAANVPLVIFIIFTLLMLQLHSFSRAVLVFLTGPLGVAGAALALLILHRPFGFVAQLGVIALFGMIIRNSVILIDQIEQDIARGEPAWNAVVESAVRRLRPILLTAAAAVLAMIPLSRSIFWGPMAVAIMGGLIIATGLTLLFLPALYALCFKVNRHK